MTRLQLNMKLNALITDFLEEGGDPSWLADNLRDVANEVFEEPMTPDRHESGEHIALMQATGLLDKDLP